MNEPEPSSGVVFVRNFVFGVEDSLVSTAGLLSGIAAAGLTRSEILLSGTVLIFVEAFSMGIGSFLSEESTEEFVTKRAASGKRSLFGGVVMFVSYLFSGFIPLGPYLLTDTRRALLISIVLSLGALFSLGVVSGRISRISVFKSGIRMLLIGGFAVVIGIIVGGFIQQRF